MKPAVQVKCPNCQNLLRVPPDMADISVKCKRCGFILQLKKKSGQAPVAAVPAPQMVSNQPTARAASPAAPPPVKNAPPTPNAGDLPEYMPPAPAVATAQRPMPTIEELPEEDQSDYNPAFGAAGRHSRRGQYKGPKKSNGTAKWIAVGSVVALGAGVLLTVLVKPDLFGDKPSTVATNPEKKNDQAAVGPAPNTNQKGADPRGVQPVPENQTGLVPRRLLAIGVSNYLYANTIQYGSKGNANDRNRHDFFKAIERLADGWRIPKDPKDPKDANKGQRYYVTDGPTEDGKNDNQHPPLRMVIDGTIDSFLNSCRQQDRIVIVFAGHAIEKDGAAYLVPLEGELEDISTLMPLKDFYAKLDKCVAQEKLVIFDVCRFFPGKGFERPAFGEMTEALEKALHDCPDGVAVWTSCSTGQYSFEDDYAELSLIGLGKPIIQGSYFFSLFFPAYEKGIFGKREIGTGNIQHPADPLPIKPVTDFIGEKTNAVAKELQNKPQTPKLTVKPRKQAAVAYNPNEPLAAKIELTKPPATARREEVVAMFQELDLPAIKAIRGNANSLPLADSFPFTEAQVKDFFNDGPTYDEMVKAPNKFAKEYPVRAATVEAIAELKKLKNDGQDLPEEFKSPVSDDTKKLITNKFQHTVAERQGILTELKDKLEEVAKKRDTEKSKRWLANYDYVYAQVSARWAYINEYNLALGNVKTEKLPELTKIHEGWKLSAVTKMTSAIDIRNVADEAKTGFGEIATKYPNTPWAVMSKAQKNMAFGLKWEPKVKEGETEPAAK